MLAKPPRRVLPEHEGGYKITLPSGTTPRSKEILAKKAHRELYQILPNTKNFLIELNSTVYSDKTEKKGIFDRLELEKNGHHQYETVDLTPPETRIKVTGLEKPASSVFARLGGIKPSQQLDDDDVVMLSGSRSFSGILKRQAAKVFESQITS